VLLLHGFPDAWFAWRYQIPTLAGRNRVIALHPFGYGETEEATVSYDKRTMARDVRELMRRLGFEKATIVAHDRGARVAKDYADAIDGLVVMDNIPTHIIFETRSPRS
jgi:haloacetate dehalogenase